MSERIVDIIEDGTGTLTTSTGLDITGDAQDVLDKLKTVDGAGSGLDADLLDGQQGAFYQNASNINAGTVSDARLPDTISSNITGNSATATKLATARTIALGGDASGSVSFDGSANATIPVIVANDSHTHDTRYFTEAESNSLFVRKSGDTMTGQLVGAGTNFDIGLSPIDAQLMLDAKNHLKGRHSAIAYKSSFGYGSSISDDGSRYAALTFGRFRNGTTWGGEEFVVKVGGFGDLGTGTAGPEFKFLNSGALLLPPQQTNADSATRKDYVDGQRSITGNGYQKLSGGLIIQWGRAFVTPSGTWVNFPIAFPNACASLAGNHEGSNSAVNVVFNNISNASFVPNVYNSANTHMLWIATGY